MLVDPLCKDYHKDNGMCIDCYEGYDLIDGECRWSTQNKFAPPYIGCRNFDADDQICLQCKDAFEFRGEICFLRLDFCSDRNADGSCNECVTGYELNEETNECVWSPPEGGAPGVNDPGCRRFDNN